jgi:hypothetical protein
MEMTLEAGILVALALLKVVLILSFGDQPMIRVGVIGAWSLPRVVIGGVNLVDQCG